MTRECGNHAAAREDPDHRCDRPVRGRVAYPTGQVLPVEEELAPDHSRHGPTVSGGACWVGRTWR